MWSPVQSQDVVTRDGAGAHEPGVGDQHGVVGSGARAAETGLGVVEVQPGGRVITFGVTVQRRQLIGHDAPQGVPGFPHGNPIRRDPHAGFVGRQARGKERHQHLQQIGLGFIELAQMRAPGNAVGQDQAG